MTTRWGIAGTGRMAGVMADAFTHVANGELVAVGSRSAGRAAAFAAGHGIETAHGTYRDLCGDDGVDAVYIATPHPHHADIALTAIESGKAILVEKAFTSSVDDTARVIEAARAAGVFCMEAMWTRFNPAVDMIRWRIGEGVIGDLRGVHGDLTAYREFDPGDRLFAPELGGGAVLDLGVYVLSFAQHFLGTPQVVRAVGGTYRTGIESDVAILLGYADGRTSALTAGFTAHGPARMMLTGTKGWIDVHPRFHRATAITVRHGKEKAETLQFPAGYQYEVMHVGECLDRGLTESPVMPLDDTLAVQRLMADVLTQLGRD
ncbi:MAG: oxidoreductase [Micrococcales bacterium]|nr:MAG: oxidoreductase [Micrococcales bacterium]PIE28125.1 MAG: oxidoreductase [Micrococcales bacterium]